MKLLLATDGTPGAAGAVRLALELHRTAGAEVQVLRILPPVGLLGPGIAEPVAIDYQAVEEARMEAAVAQTRQSLREIDPDAAAWPLSLDVGSLPFLVAVAAQETAATHILMGSGHHDRLRRWLGNESVPRVAQVAHVPVLAAPRTAGRRPEHVVVATDLSAFSRDALRTAAEIAVDGARIEVIRVIGPTSLDVPFMGTEAGDSWDEVRQSLRDELEKWVSESGLKSEASVGLHLLEGTAVEEILGFAERGGADLIAVGSHGFGYFGRIMLGSVSTALVRRAQCSVLIAPPREPAPEIVRD
jgi:nucleotide-binding universal stress UspA family protein